MFENMRWRFWCDGQFYFLQSNKQKEILSVEYRTVCIDVWW